MIIHLERCSCESGIDELDLNESAAKCFQWKQFISENWRSRLLHRIYLSRVDDGLPFFCPSCDREFHCLSALFQHVASLSCDEDLGGHPLSKLLRWLERRHQL